MSKARERKYVDACRRAGIFTPQSDTYEKTDFPHYHVFVTMQRAQPHATRKVIFANARVIARFGPERVVKVTLPELILAGFDVSPPTKR